MQRLTGYCVAPILLAYTALACATGAPQPSPFAGATRVDFEDAKGRLAIRFEPGKEGIRVEKRGGEVLAILRNQGKDIEILGAGEQSLWRIEESATPEQRFRVRHAATDRVAFVMKRDPDGDIKIDDESGRRLAELKRRDYGYKLVSGEGKPLARIRAHSGKISLRDPAGRTYLSSRDPFPVEATAILALEALPVEVAAGLAAAVAFWSPESPTPP